MTEKTEYDNLPGWEDCALADESEIPVLDAEHGRCISCHCIQNEVVDPAEADPALPTSLGAEIEVEYEDGWKNTSETLFAPILNFGFLKAYSEEGDFGRLGDKGLIAFLGEAGANLEGLQEGKTYSLPSSDVAEKTLAALKIPTRLIRPERKGIQEAWLEAWKNTGKLVKMIDGNWYVERLIPERNDHLKVARFVDGREVPIKHG